MSMLNKFRTSQVMCKLNKCTRRGMAELKPDASIKPHTEAAYTSPNSTLGDVHRVSNVERYFLVWTKKFKSVKDVPGYVSRDMMEKARNIMRIRVNLSIIAICLVGALLAAQSGKKAAGRGETLTKNNLQWHKDYNDSQNAQPPK
ncbi:UPF0389 protein CG9231-like isoform X1 [Daphnia carinata]|uniref:UPF0389 protein CG9231-like isoform X1 n=1 Tax=Daphnia carinata TaxID=120202 RepID=UPI00257A8A7C|nr:UPF0389 protein CG9231-like isoform X1 [Daphnia carinata]